MDNATILHHYLHAALWTEGLDGEFDIKHFSPSAMTRAKSDVDSFVKQAKGLLSNLTPEMIGHDFWLTRNHHGAGFWDRGYDKDIADKLTDISQTFKEINLEVGDGDNKIYFL
jgi:hypothetical protein